MAFASKLFIAATMTTTKNRVENKAENRKMLILPAIESYGPINFAMRYGAGL